ncbi:hypothetical protein BaRGS_00036455 [Batillaria attramentaria]|uniref:Uncharacterized protein n=1 Tax=Batillaria attramentaria TaxID=370345 RepID=A0ABD0JBT5_9CAEN
MWNGVSQCVYSTVRPGWTGVLNIHKIHELARPATAGKNDTGPGPSKLDDDGQQNPQQLSHFLPSGAMPYAEEADWRWQTVRIQHEYSLHGKVTTAGQLARTAVLVSRSATWGSHSGLSRHGGECFQCYSCLDNGTEKLTARTACLSSFCLY